MGSWNKTCGISNLHIMEGTPVYVFVLEKNLNYDPCYTTSHYFPTLTLFESVYNDYGGGENSSGPWFPHIMDAVKERLVEMELGENQYHDIEVKKDKFDEKLFFDAVHEKRLFVKSLYPRQDTLVDFVMMRKSIVDNMLENWKVTRYVGRDANTHESSYDVYTYHDVVADIPAYVSEAARTLEETNETKRVLFSFDKSLDMVKGEDYPRLSIYLGFGSSSFNYNTLINVREVIVELLSDKKTHEVEQLLTEYIKGVFVEMMIDSLRKQWLPGGHEGSQQNELEPYETLINAMSLDIKEEKEEQEEW